MYESSGFLRLNTLVGYYAAESFIVVPANADGADADAHTLVLYLHGSVPPVSFALFRSCNLVCSILTTALCSSRAGRDVDAWGRVPAKGARLRVGARLRKDDDDTFEGGGVDSIELGTLPTTDPRNRGGARSSVSPPPSRHPRAS
jgi:hypothetical protein